MVQCQQFLWKWRVFDDGCRGNEDVPEAADDEKFFIAPFMNQIISKQNWSMRKTKLPSQEKHFNGKHRPLAVVAVAGEQKREPLQLRNSYKSVRNDKKYSFCVFVTVNNTFPKCLQAILF